METEQESPNGVFTDDPRTRTVYPAIFNRWASKDEINKTSEELRDATLAFYDLDEKDEAIKAKKAKAHKRLILAREEMRSLKLNY